MRSRKRGDDGLESSSVVVPFPGRPDMSATANVMVERRLMLHIRTSLLCEFRSPAGLLQAFEVCYGQTSFGVLCNALLRMPGVEFPNHDPQAWFRRPTRFRFKGHLFEISIPFDNIRVAPVELSDDGILELDELLEYVRHNVLRARASRYTVR